MSAPSPRAWLQEPKVQRHAGMHLVRGVRTVEPTAEEYEFAELDGDVFIPLYDAAALAAARRQALEDAARVCEALIDGRFPSAIELDEKLQEAAAAIRALMEKP